MAFESLFARALNHLLDTESWARERLAPFAGEALELQAPPFPSLRFAVAPDGRLQPALGDKSSLVVRLRADAPAAALRGGDYLLSAIDVQGNARLANEIMFLARHLRWDVEEDLSRLVGDIAAHRIAGTARTLMAWHADAARRLAEGVVEYATEEARLLLRRDELAEVADAHARLRDGLERLEQRIKRMER